MRPPWSKWSDQSAPEKPIHTFFEAQSDVTLVAPADQVQQWKEKNPDNIDEMPVQAHNLDRREIVRREAVFPRAPDQPNQETHADNHMQGMKSRHRKIEEEI